MKRLLQSFSVLLCLCLLLSVGVMAAGTGKTCTIKEGDMMFTLPEGLRKVSVKECETLADPEIYSQIIGALLSGTGLGNEDGYTQVLTGVSSPEDGNDRAFLGLMIKVGGYGMDETMDYSLLDDDTADMLNVDLEATSKALSEKMGGIDIRKGLWKSEQTYYTRIRCQITTSEDHTLWADGYATGKNGEMYVYVYLSSQKKMRLLGEDIMKTMVLERHTYYPGGFPDLKGHWAAENAAKSVELGLFKGNTATEFAPDNAMTRAMLVQVLYRMQGSPEAGTSKFSDVADDAWYAKAVAWASENGIVKGAGGKFDPDGLLTREQLAAILWRYAKFEERDVSVGEDTNILSYKDAQDVSSYAVSPLQWACGEGLIKGASGKLMPQNTTTRAQVATILVRYLAA